VTVDRLFGASPGLAAPVYRLSKDRPRPVMARREVLPPVTIGPEQVPAQYEISVSRACRAASVLWRIRRIAGQQRSNRRGRPEVALRRRCAPMGFFAARPDGTITYANWLAARHCSAYRKPPRIFASMMSCAQSL
jgi:two-component system cell cycle sensor histidine kinase/response regulator CckA